MKATALGLRLRRRLARLACPPGPLRDYYGADIAPFATPFDRVPFLAIDLETSGLDPARDDILSVGYVGVVDGAVRLGEAGHRLVRPSAPVPERAAVVHRLLDDRLATAPPLETALADLLGALRGRVPIAHHAAIEAGFLDAACRRLYGHPLVTPFVDTLALARRSAYRRNQEMADGALRLSAVRARHGLPPHQAHDALADALAAAELFIAQAAHASGRRPAALGDLIA